MKKLAITLSAVALMLSAIPKAFGTADSNETTISSKAKTSFDRDFGGAENATWVKKDDVYFVTFDVNNKQNEAAFNEEGDLVAMSRVVSKNQLPLTVSLAISEKFRGYDIAKIATEVIYENQTHYYINVANDRQLLKLKCAVNGDITIDRQTKK